MVLNLFKKKKKSREKSSGVFKKLIQGLSKTKNFLFTDIDNFFSKKRAIDENLLEEIEEILIMSDIGIEITDFIMKKISKKSKKLASADELKELLKQELLSLFPEKSDKSNELIPSKPHVIMVVGVNGTGKTTTLGKLAIRYTLQGKKVMIAAADTFRAAAIEQLEIWAKRANASIIKHKEGSDPAAVAFDSVGAAIARDIDVLLIDTAGRLHTQKNLMNELKKIKLCCEKKLKQPPQEILMTIDATTGQNGLSQAKLFHEYIGITDIALTKLDGTSKGGIVACIAKNMNIPIKYIGVGESIEDLQDFDAKLFVNALFE
ncbi:MAG: signal recognition particle-docking protein FtsY [Desulfobacteraceae bacterium 4572_130]|nr:MAG: signal recognition particle-docking protein FtsY [Desulfobacteraceae bacterium 4572_130]